METVKRKRGRPRKNIENNSSEKQEENDEKKDENIVLYLAISDDSDNDSGDDNRFTTHDTETKNNVSSLSESDTDDEPELCVVDQKDPKKLNPEHLVEEIRKRDVLIQNLKNKEKNRGMSTGGSANGAINSSINQSLNGMMSGSKNGSQNGSHNGKNGKTTNATRTVGSNGKHLNVDYHCAQLADYKTGTIFVPKKTNVRCWWCDENFDNLPSYIVNVRKNGCDYIFGNFCSFNCGIKYNFKMLNDSAVWTRHALTLNLKARVTGDNSPIKPAFARELLKSKGGKYTIEEFREGFTVMPYVQMSMPPLIPLVHTVVDG
jgi:hypothetical protein